MSFLVSIPKECSFLINSSGEGPDAPRELSRGASSSPGPKNFVHLNAVKIKKMVGIVVTLNLFSKKFQCLKRCVLEKQCYVSFRKFLLSSHCVFIGIHDLVDKLFPYNENQDY